MKYLFIFLYLSILLNGESFLTQKEYAKMLYYNPRGISCHKCHGENAKGKVLINYIHKKQNKTIKALDLTKSSKKKFIQILSQRRDKKSIMPEYFLTIEEIEALYFYVQTMKKKKKK